MNDETGLPSRSAHLARSSAGPNDDPGGGRLIYSFAKNSREEVRAQLTTFHGRRLADIRVYRADEADVDHPTRKGIALRVEDLPKLLAAVEALIAAEKRGRR
jgi:hypothetical protein